MKKGKYIRTKEIQEKRIKSRRENGWFKNPEETKKKMRDTMIKVCPVNNRKEYHHSEKTRKKMRESLKGRVLSTNHKTKISKARNGKKYPKLSKAKRELIASGKIKAPMQDRKHTTNSRKKMSDSAKKNWSDDEYKARNIKNIMKSMFVRPTSYEQKISDLCIKNNLPFVYTGNGTFLIGLKNPDFINEDNKIAIEVYADYYKIKTFGSCENYEEQRSEYFAKYGWNVMFIRTEEITSEDWEGICLNKINSFIKEEEIENHTQILY